MRSTYVSGSILVLALVAASCSGGDESSQIASLESDTTNTAGDAGATDADPTADTEAARLAFTECLREQGIEIDDPTVDADGNVQLPPIEFSSEFDGTNPESDMAAVVPRALSGNGSQRALVIPAVLECPGTLSL